MKKIFAAAFLLIFTSSCATQQFKMSETAPKVYPQYDSSQPFFFYGISQTKEVNTSAICGGDSKVAEVKNTLAPLDALVNTLQSLLIIVQIYSPRTTTVTCE